jgi:hypothetical protein
LSGDLDPVAVRGELDSVRQHSDQTIIDQTDRRGGSPIDERLLVE